MRVVALEEHFTVPALVQRIDQNAISRRGFRSRTPPATGPNPLELLPEIGEQRLKSMDEAGITVQVLSNSGPGPDLLPGSDGVAMKADAKADVALHPARDVEAVRLLPVFGVAVRRGEQQQDLFARWNAQATEFDLARRCAEQVLDW